MPRVWRRRRRSDCSDTYLLSLLVFLLVALVGAGLVHATPHDLLGIVLLVGGDASFITALIVYVRGPGGEG